MTRDPADALCDRLESLALELPEGDRFRAWLLELVAGDRAERRRGGRAATTSEPLGVEPA